MTSKPQTTMSAALETALAPSSAVQQPTPGAKRIKHLIFQALEDGYDDVAERYRPGWDDARVAKETGASPEFVKKVREEEFGPIKAPSEVEAIEIKIDALMIHAQKLKQDLVDLKKRNDWS